MPEGHLLEYTYVNVEHLAVRSLFPRAQPLDHCASCFGVKRGGGIDNHWKSSKSAAQQSVIGRHKLTVIFGRYPPDMIDIIESAEKDSINAFVGE